MLPQFGIKLAFKNDVGTFKLAISVGTTKNLHSTRLFLNILSSMTKSISNPKTSDEIK